MSAKVIASNYICGPQTVEAKHETDHFQWKQKNTSCIATLVLIVNDVNNDDVMICDEKHVIHIA